MLWIGLWAALALLGVNFNRAFLLGASSLPIVITAYSYREGGDAVQYWLVIGAYCLLHIAVFAGVPSGWIPARAASLLPLFIPDYILMAYLLPKLSGIAFVYE